MKIVLQRVSKASVSVDQTEIGRIGQGILLYVGFGAEDSSGDTPNEKNIEKSIEKNVEKIANLRIFPDERGRFHHSLLDIKGAVLVIPNFTLYGDTAKGRRPEFFGALAPELASQAFDHFCGCFRSLGVETACGKFGAHMYVESINDGPVTMLL